MTARPRLPAVPGDQDRLLIENRDLSIVVLPRKGADIYSIIDRPTGIDVLFKTPWGWHDPATLTLSGDSQRDWLARYPGGWQQLIPNAGPERRRDGIVLGYHGEAAILQWQVDKHTHNAARLTTRLRTLPLRLTRELTLDGPVLHVNDTITNNGHLPLKVMWVQHPAFGAPFIDHHCLLDFGARTLLSDTDAPGTRLTADTRYDLTPTPARQAAKDKSGQPLRAAPGAHSEASAFGCLTDFTSGWYSISSPTHGFGIRIDWDTAIFPHAWFWQECHASPGHPWFTDAYVIAIEPANVIPGNPSEHRPERGIPPSLSPSQTWSSKLTFTRTSP